jgi:sulfatase maturation enzyme AslB (radical SAM superfamily)
MRTNDRLAPYLGEFTPQALWNFFTRRWSGRVDLRDLATLVRNASETIQYPQILGVEVTWHCNLRCDGCYIPNLAKKKDVYMPVPTMESILDAEGPKSKMIIVLGGEPLDEVTYPLLYDVLSNRPHLNFGIGTNGSYLAQNGAGSLGDLHNIVWTLSIDGDRETHNRIRRGKLRVGRTDQFHEVELAIGALRQRKKYIGASITVRESTFDCITSEQFQDTLLDLGIIGATYIRARGCQDELSAERYEAARKILFGMSRRREIINPAWGDPNGSGTDTYIVYAPNGVARIDRVGSQETLTREYRESPMITGTQL